MLRALAFPGQSGMMLQHSECQSTCPCKESCTHQKKRGVGIMHTAVQVWAKPCVFKAELNAFECF